MHWLNAPKRAIVATGKVQVQVSGGTDFWRVTHCSLIRNNGHFYYQEQAGNFVAKVKIAGHCRSLYD